MEGRGWETSSENGSEKDIQEEPLNLSASQLVQIMNCAMKRGHPGTPARYILNKKQRCIESPDPAFGIQSCSSPSLLSGRSRQELIQRNKYLERRVKELENVEDRVKELENLENRVRELEKLNQMLQYGLVQSVRGTIIETLKCIVPVSEPAQPVCSPPVSVGNTYSCSQQNMPPDTLPSWSRNDEVFKNVVTSSSRSPDTNQGADINGAITIGRESFSATERHSPQDPQDVKDETSMYCQNIPGQQQLLQIKQEPENDTAATPSSSPPEVITTYGFTGTLAHNTYRAFTGNMDNSCQNEMVTSSVPTIKVLGMANEIQQAVSESTNYKKLTNRLLNILFDREELACSTLTGKSKGERTKEKLDEDTVNLIIQQAVLRFPGTSPSDVRVVISQNCKDKALRLHKSNKQQPTSSVLYPPTGLPPAIIYPNSGMTWMEPPVELGQQMAAVDNEQNKLINDHAAN